VDWPIIFLLVVLKIPVLYLCAVVWWAIKAKPEPPPGDERTRSWTEPRPPWTRRPHGLRPLRGGPHGSPSRLYPRPGHAAAARAERR
jgi:hypothetical protein